MDHLATPHYDGNCNEKIFLQRSERRLALSEVEGLPNVKRIVATKGKKCKENINCYSSSLYNLKSGKLQ